MMLKHSNILLADSGGTKTDWIAIGGGRIIDQWTGSSLHPVLLDHFSDSIPGEYLNYHLEFFGAGCHSETGKLALISKLKSLGFTSINVNSDLYEAGLSLFGKDKGCGFISGTGSVAFKYDGESITDIYGGLGHILGDEGSGFYFGKLLLVEYLNNRLPKEIEDFLSLQLGSRAEILPNVYGSECKAYVSKLSELTQSIKHDVITNLHKKNIELFVESFVGYNTGATAINACGSYAYHYHEHFKVAFEKRGVSIGRIIKRPLEKIAENMLNNTL
ncbi:MAG: hypothetical protein EP305_06400 [Bacteroidetes bacterium]|nr:MAG: hypothetical protein EP305_06400 [Bacteroidota bacterium]